MEDKKELAKLYDICGKIENVFKDVYITSNGYVIGYEHGDPYLITFSDPVEVCNDFFKVCGLFRVLHINDMRNFRKFFSPRDPKTTGTIDDYYNIVDSKPEIEKIKQTLSEKINSINSINNWESFIIKDDENLANDIVEALFANNQQIEFKPISIDDEDNPIVMLTKSIIPLITKKNIGNLYYTTKKENKDLYLIIFNIELEYFRLNMIYYYIPFNTK